MLAQELGDDQSLANVGGAVHHHAGHALLLRRIQQPFQPVKSLAGAWVVDPAVSLQRLDALGVLQCQHLTHGRVKVGERSAHLQISTLKASAGLS